MRKTFTALFAVYLGALLVSTPALAADAQMIKQEAKSSLETTAETIPLPIEITQATDKSEIRKIYELAPDFDPSNLPRDGFELGDYSYECLDILREVVIGEESKTLSVTETIESEKKDMDTVLSLLPQFKEAEDEEGYSGTLMLDTSTIKSEVSEYGSKSSSYTVTRSYPNLSSTDTQYIPKTVDDGGKKLQLSDVQWVSGNTVGVDYNELPDSYTAVASYSGTRTTKYENGYIISALYTGEAKRKAVTKIRYTVIFSGTLLPTPEPDPITEPEMSEETEKPVDSYPAWMLLAIFLSVFALLLSTGCLYFVLVGRRKEKTNVSSINPEEGNASDISAYEEENIVGADS